MIISGKSEGSFLVNMKLDLNNNMQQEIVRRVEMDNLLPAALDRAFKGEF
jgi:hypothetical protein